MSDQFVAEIRIFGFNFAPTGWAYCDGQLLPISQNTALFSLLGTFYGGDGRSTFALPNLQGSVPVHTGGSGQGPGLSLYALGESLGVETVTLLTSEMPAHTHNLTAITDPALIKLPATNTTIARSRGATAYQPGTAAADAMMAIVANTVAGGSQPHTNLMPTLVLNFCIALQGIFPARQ